MVLRRSLEKLSEQGDLTARILGLFVINFEQQRLVALNSQRSVSHRPAPAFCRLVRSMVAGSIASSANIAPVIRAEQGLPDPAVVVVIYALMAPPSAATT